MAALLLFAALFHGEIASLLSIQRLPEARLYTMDYKADYGLDEFLQSGAGSDAELVGFITKRLLKGIPMTFDLPDLGCSTFAANLQDGTPIFARNFDMYDSPAMLVTTRPQNGYASISMVNLAYIGYDADHLPDQLADSILALAAPYAPLDGVNEKGLAVGVLLIPTEPTNQQTGKVPITTTSAIRMLLDRAATVDE
ncbi:MAG: linear amide C-N hydrolase, partial [Clostridia bacterium]|nr:linear amide C-N hydrolase [Clostridia bacterium]